jgi:hypothetical protein
MFAYVFLDYIDYFVVMEKCLAIPCMISIGCYSIYVNQHYLANHLV